MGKSRPQVWGSPAHRGCQPIGMLYPCGCPAHALLPTDRDTLPLWMPRYSDRLGPWDTRSRGTPLAGTWLKPRGGFRRGDRGCSAPCRPGPGLCLEEAAALWVLVPVPGRLGTVLTAGPTASGWPGSSRDVVTPAWLRDSPCAVATAPVSPRPGDPDSSAGRGGAQTRRGPGSLAVRPPPPPRSGRVPAAQCG